MNLLINKKTLYFWISGLLSIVIYHYSPTSYSYNYTSYCCIQFIVTAIIFFKISKKNNYFDFETFFIFTYFCTFFLYPVFVYPIDPYYFFIFNYEFNENTISKATAMALVGFQMFILGNISFHPKKTNLYIVKRYSTSAIINISILFFILFLLAGGYNYYSELYAGNTTAQEVKNSMFLYLNMFFWVFLLLSISMEMYRMLYIDKTTFNYSKINKRLVVFICIYIPLLLSTGTRGASMQTILIIGGLYSMFYQPFSLKRILPLITIGMVAMFFISSTRGGGEFRIHNLMDIFMDLVINNRNTFVAIDYVEINGYSYGISMLGYILRTIPFAQGIVFELFNIDPNLTNSATILSIETLGDNPSFGVGTNIIADVYIAFGILGVIIFMFWGGYFIARVQSYAKRYSLNNIIIYSILISLAIYSVRAEFFFCLYLIVWSYLLLSLIKFFQKHLCVKKYL